MKYHISFDVDFKRNPYKGRYIVIEGIDGSGKTTQVERLCEYLKKSKISCVCTKEPRKTAGVVGRLINKILKAKVEVPPVAFQYLFSADRAIHHQELIIPALRSGKTVVSDRSFWSAVPYGIMDQILIKGGKYDYKMAQVILAAQSILSMYHRFMIPNITFYLKISVDSAMTRLKEKHDGNEIYEKKEILEKVAAGYEWLVNEFPSEFVVLDGERSVDIITSKIIEKIKTKEK